MDERYVVYKSLLRVEKEFGYSTLTLNSALERSETNSAFVSRIFYGVIERKITLDYQIGLYSDKPVGKIKPEILTLLRMGVYQIIYMNSVPDSAAINESVSLAKKLKFSFASGFINAVLRKVACNGEVLPAEKDDRLYFSVKYSCPVWLVSSFINTYGAESTESILNSSLGAKPVFARVNTHKISKCELLELLSNKGVKTEAISGFKNSFVIKNLGSVTALESFKAGYFYIEDLSSQICADALQAEESDKVLDICAAPGGKSFTISQSIGSGSVTSCDIYDSRVELIKEGCTRLGINCITPVVNDATVYNEKLGQFDRVLCDVPCSGFGVIGRKPEIKYKSFDEVENLPSLQLDILKTAFMYLKSGGTLIYSTCTLLERENEKIVKSFLKANSGAQFISQRTILPSEYNSDGFYYCILKKA